MSERNIPIASNHFKDPADISKMASVSSQGRPEIIRRTTKKGRKLRYELAVIQQPERARACGAGAKSSADRRPVDPPPVVQLCIFDETDGGNSEITFQYNANFFLFATLEVTRPIAAGRVQPQAPQVPVLTGMPVSGMAYLDRPQEAGYFIFPDLSVRHEGIYKLSFNLYEETKSDEDSDQETADEANQRKMSNAGPMDDPSFDWRMEIKSCSFQVFSAKKFPGLNESTSLSRTVAEQGCRVRIRRDVRMRRRDTKQGNDFDDGDDDYARPGRAASPPSAEYQRQRSSSLGSNEDPQSQRRASGEFSPYHSPTPDAPNTHGPPGSYLNFVGPSTFPAPQAPQFSHPPPPQPQQPAPASYQPTPNSYQSQGPAPPFRQQGPPPPPPSAAPTTYNYTERPPYSQFHPSHPPPPPPRNEVREPYEPEYRRHSVGYNPPHTPHTPHPIAPAPQNPPYNQPIESSYNRNGSISAYSNYSRDSVSLAPLRAEHPAENKFGGASSPLAPISTVSRLASMPGHGYDRFSDRSGPFGQYPLAPNALMEAEPIRLGKRAFGSAFSSAHEPLFNGQRPSSSHQQEIENDDALNDSLAEQFKMGYKRADGTIVHRPAPLAD